MGSEERPGTFEPGADWNPAPPVETPGPTIWPAVLSLGSTLLLWGLIGSRILSGVGAVVLVVALAGWIRDIRHERKQQSSSDSGAGPTER